MKSLKSAYEARGSLKKSTSKSKSNSKSKNKVGRKKPKLAKSGLFH